MTTSGTTSGNECKRMTMSGYFGKFFFFLEREESSNRHPKENPLNLEDDPEEDLLI